AALNFQRCHTFRDRLSNLTDEYIRSEKLCFFHGENKVAFDKARLRECLAFDQLIDAGITVHETECESVLRGIESFDRVDWSGIHFQQSVALAPAGQCAPIDKSIVFKKGPVGQACRFDDVSFGKV